MTPLSCSQTISGNLRVYVAFCTNLYRLSYAFPERWRVPFGGLRTILPSGQTFGTSSFNVQTKSKHVEDTGSSASGPITPALLDLRVGHIIRAIKHPNADSLYVSTIDCGDAPGAKNTFLDLATGRTVRPVCSALDGRTPLSEMQNRRVVVMANLKPIKMRGIISATMVLAAVRESAAERRSIELVCPPDSTEVGQRLGFEELANDLPLRLPSLKDHAWGKLQAGLKTNDIGEVAFQESAVGCVEQGQKRQLRRLISGDGGECKVPSLYNADVRKLDNVANCH